MKKKFLAMVSATLLIFSSFTFLVSATESSNSADTTKSTFSTTVPFSFEDIDSTDSNALITRNPDGTFSKTVYDFSSIRQKSNLNTEPYLPKSASLSTTEKTSVASVTDQYGRELNDPADPRIGHLLANYDTDGDGDIDASYYGTASLQERDLLISCAHIVWKPEYAHLKTQGWASKVVFYAGRSASREYVASEVCTYTSIPQNYVSLSSCSINGNSGGPIIDDSGYVYGIATHISLSENQWVSTGGVRMYDDLFVLIISEREASVARWE